MVVRLPDNREQIIHKSRFKQTSNMTCCRKTPLLPFIVSVSVCVLKRRESTDCTNVANLSKQVNSDGAIMGKNTSDSGKFSNFLSCVGKNVHVCQILLLESVNKLEKLKVECE